MTAKTDIVGPYAGPRKYLLQHIQRMRFKNEIIEKTLEADWSHMDREQAAYVIGTIWGRLRQIDDSLEGNTEYLQLVLNELAKNKTSE